MAQVKICGLTDQGTVFAAVEAGARFLGFNFFPRSPRFVKADQVAAISRDVPPGVARVGLFVDPDDAMLQTVLSVAPLDVIQLHGSEPPERVVEIKKTTGLPVMKAVGVAAAEDLQALWDYGLVADMLLIDAKAPAGSVLPGGNGLRFDWRLLAGVKPTKPWMLAGGLTPDSVCEAVRLTGAKMVDVASGVESAPGVKDADLIGAFVKAANSHE
ncbi:phosphoribosylanthranilate isomerase [Paracoccus sp. TK19116]|uniref:N-(5'-phosphoribosyl)anthranilate isomerase n=1 Tax=Paracoccus albicereus TaxID=2922394 RepID=A0ABT1MR40_9RHOB|nr:phosphoribosylanthranilate isomerase [Paracoccus albicereus]MCQ0970763.1 phosphoribosylanthranilate isomerase [Paracoccus albicereus]